jgi:hypothetical protein
MLSFYVYHLLADWFYLLLTDCYQSVNQSIKDMIFTICCSENSTTAGRAAVLIWNLWQNRNDQVWNNTKLSARQVGLKAAKMWEDWAIVQGVVEEQKQHIMQQETAAPTSG